jgi:hypothetical protein
MTLKKKSTVVNHHTHLRGCEGASTAEYKDCTTYRMSNPAFIRYPVAKHG